MVAWRDSSKNTVTEQINNPTYRVSGAGENVGLNLRIEIEKDAYVAYSKSFYGAKILIHDAENFPQTSVTTTTIGQPGFDLTIAVMPSVIVSEPGIRSLSQKQRNCLFDDEVRIRRKLMQCEIYINIHDYIMFTEKTAND